MNKKENISLSPSTEGALLAIAETMQELAAAINRYVDCLVGQAKQKEEDITIEEVRGELAQLAQKGLNKELKELLNRFGGNKLTEVHKKYYGELLREAGKFNG